MCIEPITPRPADARKRAVHSFTLSQRGGIKKHPSVMGEMRTRKAAVGFETK